MRARLHVSRRLFCVSAAGTVLPAWASAQPRDEHGRVAPPIPVPDIPIVQHDGVKTRLPTIVKGRATALQVMFTSCSTACPIEGATFARVQKLVPDQLARGIQLLSLSVDAKNDTPDALRTWLQRFHAVPGWIAAAPTVQDTDRLKSFAGAGRNPADNHSTQVLMIDRQGRLVWRTFELPEAEDIVAMLLKM